MARSRKSRSAGEPAASTPLPPPAAPRDPVAVLNAAPATLDREFLAWLMLGLFATFVAGFWLVKHTGSAGNELSFDRAVFSAMSGVTLTGLRQDVNTSPFAADSAVVPLAMLLMTLGGAYLTLLASSLPACRLLGLPYGTGRIAKAAGLILLVGVVLGTLLLVPSAGGYGVGKAWLESLVKSASAIANSGVVWGPAPRVDAPSTHLVLFPLAVMGGLGLPVIVDLFDRATGRTPALAFHTRLVLMLTAGVYIAGVLALLVLNEQFWPALSSAWVEWRSSTANVNHQARTELRTILASASALCLESRSAGFPSDAVASLPRSANFILILLMAIGGSPAGTAGGLKTTTLWLLGKSIRQGSQGERAPAIAGVAMAWLSAFVGIVSVGYAALLWAAPQIPSDRLFTIAVSAASNCGLSHDALSVVRAPLIILSIMMAAGRVVPILLLWRAAERIDYAQTTPG